MKDGFGRIFESERQFYVKSCAPTYTDILKNLTLNNTKFASGYGLFTNGKLIPADQAGVFSYPCLQSLSHACQLPMGNDNCDLHWCMSDYLSGDWWCRSATRIVVAPFHEMSSPWQQKRKRKSTGASAVVNSEEVMKCLENLGKEVELSRVRNVIKSIGFRASWFFALQMKAFGKEIDSLNKRVMRISETQHRLVLAGDDEKTRIIPAVQDALKCRICLFSPTTDMAYASCCESLVGCIECIETALEQETGNFPACNQPHMVHNLYRVAGWNKGLAKINYNLSD